MQFYFIRHGQSGNNLLWDRTGSSSGRSQDPELTEIGQRQADYLARYLKHTNLETRTQPADDLQNVCGFGITHLYTSLMVRAVATGTVVARELGLPLVAWEDLHETGGIYLGSEDTERLGQAGKNRAWFEAHYPDLILPPSLSEAGWWYNRPYEERDLRVARAERVWRDLLARHDHTADRVAVISHGGFYNYLLNALLRMSHEICWFAMNNAALTRIDFTADGVTLVYLNRTDFIPRELIT